MHYGERPPEEPELTVLIVKKKYSKSRKLTKSYTMMPKSKKSIRTPKYPKVIFNQDDKFIQDE